MAQERYEDVKTSTIALAGLIGAIAVFALILLLMVFYYQVDRQQTQIKQIDELPAEWANLKTAQEGKLASYRWVDANRKIVAIPIELAMRLVTAEVVASGRPKVVPRPTPLKKQAAPAEYESRTRHAPRDAGPHAEREEYGGGHPPKKESGRKESAGKESTGKPSGEKKS
jgi:hypothetical protein